jgi:hypothetical protein
MSDTITQAFITQFERDVHLVYQRQGSKFRGTVRTKTVVGNTVRFQKLAKGVATTKGRHADIVPMDLEHSNVEATMADYYAGDYVDVLDELKTNIDERMIVAQSGAYALGRTTDDIIIAAAETTGSTIANGGTGLTKTKVLEVFETFNANDVPDDGQRWMAISPKAWTDLLSEDSFASADFIGLDELPYKGGMTAKRWLGFNIFTHSGLTVAANIRNCIAYHMSSLGHGINSEVQTRIDYVPQKASNLINSSLSMGSVLIDGAGCLVVEVDES